MAQHDNPTAHYCYAAERNVIGIGNRDRCPFCWKKRKDLHDIEEQ